MEDRLRQIENRLDRIEKILNIKNIKIKEDKYDTTRFKSYAEYLEYKKMNNGIQINRDNGIIKLSGKPRKKGHRIKVNKLN